MPSAEDQLFQSWCRASDIEALGKLFDLAAPRLFKVAVHLVGDAAAAEDLVQGTFLALIEQRASIDSTRPVLPWLNGVLSHKAQQLRRERAQPLDVPRLHQRVVADPSAQLEQRELSAELATAIDKLSEPYRLVVLLRARHGMAIADIAHAVDRDPGTVSVQLHRGLERLRRVLPATLSPALLAVLFAGRGLAAVKASVLMQASVAARVTAGVSILGGVIVGKKIVVALCVVLIALLAYLLRTQAQTQKPALQARSAPELAPTAVADGSAMVPASESGESRQPLAPADGPLFASEVVDAESGEPLAHADVALFAGRETTPFELQRDHPDYYRVRSSELSPHTQGDWPVVVGADELALAGRRPLLSLDRPDSGQKALARTTSDAGGKFSLPAPASAFLIEASLPGYRTRWRPILDAHVPDRIELWRERELRGEVLDERGAKVTQPLELVLFAYSEPSQELLERQQESGRMLFEEQRKARKGIDFQRVTTANDGTFQATFSNARFVHAQVLSIGWVITGINWPGPARHEMVVRVARAQVLHFFDAQTRQPVERVRLLIRDLQYGTFMSCDELHAPDGLATDPLSDDVFAGRGFELTACAAGFEPARWTSTDRSPGSVVDVPLRAGAEPSVHGCVLRNGAPLENALVAVLGLETKMWNAEYAKRHLLDAVRTRECAFQFKLPAGQYLLWIRDAAGEAYVVAEAPTSEPLVIDLDQLARIEVLVVDPSSAPRANHTVALQGGDSRSSRCETNAEGVAVFAALPAGKYTVLTADVNTKDSFQGSRSQVVELAAGQRASVRLETLAATGPRHARLALLGTEDFTGWRARYGTDAWSDVTADGTIAAELPTYAPRVDVRAPDGRDWRAFIQTPAPDGTVIQLESGTGRLQGELITAQNRPCAGVRVLIKPSEYLWSVGDVVPSAVTDAEGRFSFSGLAREPFGLAFERDGRDLPMQFQLTQGAWSEQDQIRIQLATPSEEVRVSGTVRDRSGKPRLDVTVAATALIPQIAGKLRVSSDRSFTHTDSEGRFHFTLPRTPELVLRVRTPEGWQTVAERALADDGSAERTVDLTID